MKAMRQIYLDNNATTRVAPEVLEAMLPCYQNVYGNSSSVHAFGQEAKGLLDNARQQLAHLLNSEPNEIVFTSGGTESDNLAIRGVAEASPQPRKHIITTRVEHHAVLHTCQALHKAGIDVTYLPVGNEGLVDPEDVRKALGLEVGAQFVVMGDGDTVVLKRIAAPAKSELRAMIGKVRSQARRAGMKPTDIGEAVRRVRRGR